MVTTLYDYFVSMFGSYEPIEVAVNGVTQYSPDYAYIGMVLAFLIVLYSSLRILGGVICAK